MTKDNSGDSSEARNKRKRKEEKRARKKQKLLENDEKDVAIIEQESEAITKDIKKAKKEKKKEKKKKKDKKKKKRDDDVDDNNNNNNNNNDHEEEEEDTQKPKELVASSALEFYDPKSKIKDHHNDQDQDQDHHNDHHDQDAAPTAQKQHTLTLLLFYQYVEPAWDEPTYQFMLKRLQNVGTQLKLTGRMRVANEGLNCTLTAPHDQIVEYCNTLRQLRPQDFIQTEFKLTTDLPVAQKFPNLKILKVAELVNYGLQGRKAPPIHKFQGTHLEPVDYHQKLGESNTVIIDVRNHYEAAIGRFVPPSTAQDKKDGNNSNGDNGNNDPPPQWLDPKMRKSTEFPVWLDKPETKEQMKGKQVLMYCTGGIRCERASALLKYKMETDPEIKELGIQGVYQLQGGIDKYFKQFPEGGYWKGKNYVFDKRFAHAPPKIDGALHGGNNKHDNDSSGTQQLLSSSSPKEGDGIMGKCEGCQKPWDMYRGKRRCPTCGVPSLICRDCFLADKEGHAKLGKQVRCDLCVEQHITSKHELRQKDEAAVQDYERKMESKGLLKPAASTGGKGDADDDENEIPQNPNQVTRLSLRNMCRTKMDEAALMEALPGITHIVWKIERTSGNFLGAGWIEMATPDDAAWAVAQNGKLRPFGRPLYVSFQAPDGKDAWPPKSSAVPSS